VKTTIASPHTRLNLRRPLQVNESAERKNHRIVDIVPKAQPYKNEMPQKEAIFLKGFPPIAV